jgi:hypothetical protein
MEEDSEQDLLTLERINHFSKKKKKRTKFANVREESEQAKLVKYLKSQGLLYRCSPEGIKLSIGMAVKLKKQGIIVRGLPDIEIFEPIGSFHGLLIELKRTDFKLRRQNGDLYKDDHVSEQLAMLLALQKKGYAVSFGAGFEHAKQLVESYMSGDATQFESLIML